MTLGIAISGFVATLMAAFGAAYLGGRLQRSSDIQHLSLQLQINAAARFIGSVGEFQVAHGLAWAPGTENLTMTERQTPIFSAFVSLSSSAAEVAIVGPNRLAGIAEQLVRAAQARGLATSFDVDFVTNFATLLLQFKDQAMELRPTHPGESDARSHSEATD